MSKKINITIHNKTKPNLVQLFHKYLFRKAKEHEIYISDEYDYENGYGITEYWDSAFPGWDADLDNDGDVVYPLQKKGKKEKKSVYDSFWQEEREEYFNRNNNHKRKHKKGKKSKPIDITVPYSGDEESLDEYSFDGISLSTEDYEPEGKEIWYYPDYHCKEDRLEFNSLKDFSDYCDTMGYFVDENVADDIEWRYESHCCLNPESKKLGLMEIMAEHSYGDLFYEACDGAELDY
jgi:hypothetical protein